MLQWHVGMGLEAVMCLSEVRLNTYHAIFSWWVSPWLLAPACKPPVVRLGMPESRSSFLLALLMTGAIT